MPEFGKFYPVKEFYLNLFKKYLKLKAIQIVYASPIYLL